MYEPWAKLAHQLKFCNTGKAVCLLNSDINTTGLKDLFKGNPGTAEAWKVLDEAGETALKKDITELDLVAKNLDEIEATGGYKSWKQLVTSFKNVDEIKHLLKTEKGSAFFWSGRTKEL